MRKIKFISILLVLSMVLTVPAFAFSLDFTDVPEKAVYAESVSYLANAGILRGTASGRFAPDERITVSQWATMLCRALEEEPEGTSWQEVSANAVQTAVRKAWLQPTAIGDETGFICRGELYLSAFAAMKIPLYDATTAKMLCASEKRLGFVLKTRLQPNSLHAPKPRSFFMPS